MEILILRGPASPDEIRSMLRALIDRVKVAVDVERRVVAGGGVMHADCEQILMEDGSAQEDVWGATWFPTDRSVDFQSFINIRPRQGNRSMTLQDPALRKTVEAIVREKFPS